MAGPIDIDATIMDVAGRRGGVCSRADLLKAGVSAEAIKRRVRCGLLLPICRGVYLVEQLVDHSTSYHRAVAAIPGAVLSHLTAAQLHGLAVEPPAVTDPVHVVVPHGVNRRIDGIVVHRRRRPPSVHDVMVIDRLPLTVPALTIVDLAGTVGPKRLRHIVQTAIAAGNPTSDVLVACFAATARRGVDGAALMRRTLRAVIDDEPVRHSVLERALARLLAAHDIVGFEAQVRPPWFDGWRGIVDFAHHELQVVLEADGRRWHRRDQEMADDRRRDRLAAAHGWVTIRFMWEEIVERPEATAADITTILRQRRRAVVA